MTRVLPLRRQACEHGAVTGRVASLQIVTTHGLPPQPVQEVVALPGRGLEGDVHGKTHDAAKRQVLLVDTVSLDALGLSPGDLRDQVTLDLPGLQDLPAGTRLQVGEAEIELSGPCEPCTHIGELLGKEDREEFRQLLVGRRGVLARVVAVTGGGRIRVGDPAEALPAAIDVEPAGA
jgi:MOSC domain-containing protein YiiM